MTLGEKLVQAATCCFGVADNGWSSHCDDCPYKDGEDCHYHELICDLQTLSRMAEKKDVICPNCGAFIDK